VKSFDISIDIKPLESLGLNHLESLSYLSALDLGQGTISDIAHNAGIERTALYYHIDRLIEIGLLQTIATGKRTLYKPADPKKLKEILQHKSEQLSEIFPKIDRQYSIVTSRSITEYYNGSENYQKFYHRLYGLLAALQPPNNTIYVLGSSFRKVTSTDPAFTAFEIPNEQLNVETYCILPKSQKSKIAEENLNDPYIVKRYNLPPAKIKYISDKFAYPAAVVIVNDIICLLDYKNFNYSIIENANVAQTWRMFFSLIWSHIK